MTASAALLLVRVGVAHAQTPSSAPSAARPASQPASAPARAVSAVRADQELADLQLMELEIPTVVSAARHEQKLNVVPHAISVITQEDIRLSGARSVPDALRLAPGVDVANLTYGAEAVSPRGLHGLIARPVLVLVDGRQIFDSLFGGTLWGAWPFQLEDIERIEVIRGPGGVTWGANAASGVINIITKDPRRQTGATFTGGGGSRGVQKEHLGYGLEVGKLRLRASGEYEGADGFRKGGSFVRPLTDDYQAGRANVHAIYEATPNDTFTLSGGSAITHDALPPTPLIGLTPVGRDGSQASFLLGRWQHRVAEDNRVEITGYVNDFWGSPGVKAMDYRYQQLAFQIGHTFKPAPTHTLSWGFDSRVDLLDSGNSDPQMLEHDFVSTAILGAYVQDEWQFAPRWKLDLGARMDYEFYGGFEPSARAALSYELTRHSSFYAAVSRAFQMPPVGIRFLETPILSGLVNLTSDRNVKAIPILAYEAGYRARFFDRFETDVSVYCHRFDDYTALSTKLGPPGLLRADFDNSADAILYGVEWQGRYAVNEQLTLLANYTLERMDWRGAFSEADLVSPPAHKAMLGARYSPNADLHLSAHAYYVGAVQAPNPLNPLALQRLSPYVRLDLRAEQEFWKDRASVAVGVRNLLDPDHPEGGTRFLNNAEVPRMVYAELRLRLD